MMKQNAKQSAAVPLRKLHICLTAGCGAISLTMLLTAYAMLSGQSRTVQRILSVCPQAYILPRVNLAAPLRWIAENPGETDGSGRRESLYSAKKPETL